MGEGGHRRRLTRPSPHLSTALALLLAFSWPISGLAVTAARAATHSPFQWVSLGSKLASVVPLEPLLQLFEGSNAISTGSDGRLTILLLGSDSRGGAVGLTDTIMIVSIKGTTISAASIPRDVLHIANPDGGTFSGRANAVLETLARGRTVDQALAKFKVVIEQLLQIEIDYYALVKFNGFNQLVQEVEPVPVDISRQIRDTKFWDDPTKPSGVYFPAANNYNLWAWQPNSNPPLCNGLWKTQSTPIAAQYWCRRALPFARSRKGAGNSDFVRARRQQDFVIAAVRRVINRGSGALLNSLIDRAKGQLSAGQLYTDIPLTAGNALDLYNTLSGAHVGFQAVFSPPTYSTHVPGTTAYQLDLAAVRQVARQWFGGDGNSSPTPTDAPTAATTHAPNSPPTVAPTATPTPTTTPIRTPREPTGSPSAVVPTPAPADANDAMAWLVLGLALAVGLAAALLVGLRLLTR